MTWPITCYMCQGRGSYCGSATTSQIKCFACRGYGYVAPAYSPTIGFIKALEEFTRELKESRIDAVVEGE